MLMSIVWYSHICISIDLVILQAEMDSLVEQMEVERKTYEKTQEEQRIARERRLNAAATSIQALFRGHWYMCSVFCNDLHYHANIYKK